MRHDAQTTGEGTANTTAVRYTDALSELDTPAATAATSVVGTVDELPNGSALLVVKRGPNAGARFRLDQPVTTAGRHPNSDIFLDDVTTSRRHAEFRTDNGQFRVVDTNSLNGTFVNHEPVHSAVLGDGDEIQIGNFCLTFLARPTRT